jgi:hypothetical protein
MPMPRSFSGPGTGPWIAILTPRSRPLSGFMVATAADDTPGTPCTRSMKLVQIAPSRAWSARNSSGVFGVTVRPGTVASTCIVNTPSRSKPEGTLFRL